MTRRRVPGSTTRDGYGYAHQSARARVLAGGPPCWKCGRPATHADHVPPLDYAAAVLGLDRATAAALYTTDGTGDLQLRPACAPCNLAAGGQYATTKRRAGLTPTPPPALDLGASRPW